MTSNQPPSELPASPASATVLHPGGLSPAPGPDSSAEVAGTRLGPYKLVEKLGEGGFGAVWLAEQREPVKRAVALKIVKLGMDTHQVIARFEAERQALAMMDHPNIARVFDAGATSTGRPYFVMELVRGVPITEFCAKERLDTRARLRLFVQVCSAIQHAHQKGVIHRDIKPSNVLVQRHDDRPMVRVIDFGIAKATSTFLTDKTLFTQQGQVIGTPAYMSPEQAEGSGLDIDTRTDVYSLGVLLYELLTGSTPFTQAELSRGYAEMVRIVRDVEPPRPSARISTQDGRPSRADAASPAQARALSSQLKGDLDWITLKCLEKDRARRYDSATALAADVQRHLDGEAVLAAPPGNAYRAAKFVRRHKGGVVATGFIVLALIAGMTATLWQAQRARDAEARAQQRASEAELIAQFQGDQLQAIDTQRMGADLRSSILAATPGADRAELESLLVGVNFTDIALGSLDTHVFERALATINERFAGQPQVRARLLQTVATTRASLGLLERAMAPQEEALRIREAASGRQHADTLESVLGMGDLLFRQGKLEAAEPLLREALAGLQRARGEMHASTLAASSSLGWLYVWQGKFEAAEPHLQAALDGRRRTLGEAHPDTLASIDGMGGFHYKLGRYELAERHFLEALAGLRRTLGATHPTTITSINNLAHVSIYLRKFEAAESLFEEAISGYRSTLGSMHPATMFAINGMGMALQAQGKHADAEARFREAFEGRRRVLGPAHPDTLESMGYLVAALNGLGRYEEAATLGAESIELASRGASPNPSLLARLRMRHAQTLLAQRRFTLAEPQAIAAQAACVASGANCERGIAFLIELYAAWHVAEPGKGYDAKAEEWRAQLPATADPAPGRR